MGEIGIIITLFILIFFLTQDIDYIKVKGGLGSIVGHALRMLCDCGFICHLLLPPMLCEQSKSGNLISNFSVKP